LLFKGALESLLKAALEGRLVDDLNNCELSGELGKLVCYELLHIGFQAVRHIYILWLIGLEIICMLATSLRKVLGFGYL